MGEKSAKKQWVIDLEELQSINSETEIEKRKKHYIYRVPNILRELNYTAYTPQLVSLGPYHHGKAHLNPMERKKYAALAHYLERANKTLDEVRESLRPQIRDLMDAYDSLEELWTTDEDRFLDLMILDECFFLQMMVGGNDELLRPYMNRGLWMDMRRIENQLPLLLLVILIEIGGHEMATFHRFYKVEQLSSFARNQNRVHPPYGLRESSSSVQHRVSKVLINISVRKEYIIRATFHRFFHRFRVHLSYGLSESSSSVQHRVLNVLVNISDYTRSSSLPSHTNRTQFQEYGEQ
ncbi:uncharacterized protein LOC109832752 isoform X3 [Asparagus officinalis]|uniref:uncharacterized protein LOC109832752 isoform X3 n=1 Tax=Asparagus officinalis TaxID=4686 RepID=UPI00098E06D2|nr:uncharacterized protein LOC109832752 isoform X3 [Asparagus officinalis]